jgi:hypothetical protein
MLPTSKRKLTLAEKRKLYPNPSAKRPKMGNSVATPTKYVITPAGKLPPLSDRAYFHPTAVKLFDQVKVHSKAGCSHS